MRQLSLVALYGTKNAQLEKLIRECQTQVSSIPNIRFRPYQVKQVHATIISLERFDETKYNLNYYNYRNRKRDMDFDGLLQFIRGNSQIPFEVQVGGFNDQDFSFTSRNQSPFERSFQISHDKAVIMGWPTGEELNKKTYPNTLDQLRKAFQTYNIIHTYHRNQDEVDNDFYFRLGLLDPSSITPGAGKTLENNIRTYLASCSPIILEITTSDIYVVSYSNNELPVNKTNAWPVSDLRVNSNFMWTLFS